VVNAAAIKLLRESSISVDIAGVGERFAMGPVPRLATLDISTVLPQATAFSIINHMMKILLGARGRGAQGFLASDLKPRGTH
jgi:hypothetical protein